MTCPDLAGRRAVCLQHLVCPELCTLQRVLHMLCWQIHACSSAEALLECPKAKARHVRVSVLHSMFLTCFAGRSCFEKALAS